MQGFLCFLIFPNLEFVRLRMSCLKNGKILIIMRYFNDLVVPNLSGLPEIFIILLLIVIYSNSEEAKLSFTR
jgi:hypothetical protein